MEVGPLNVVQLRSLYGDAWVAYQAGWLRRAGGGPLLPCRHPAGPRQDAEIDGWLAADLTSAVSLTLGSFWAELVGGEAR